MKIKLGVKILSVDEQRVRYTNSAMLAIGLEAHLRNLIREIKAGETGKLSEFQEFVNYAPDTMRERTLNYLHGGLR